MINFIILLSLFSVSTAFSQEITPPLIQEEKEQEVINYSNIQKVLEADGLKEIQEKKIEEVKKIIEIKKEISLEKYNYPSEEEFWSFISELWLVKNAARLSWDFPKPDYGISFAFKSLLEKIGLYQKKFKILVVNSPDITHMALPANKDSYIFMISLPFIRTLDLTKVDIAILLLEDMMRIDKMHFHKNLKIDTKFLGTNFHKSKVDYKKIETILSAYNNVIFKSGFSFQQQFKVTKELDGLLRPSPQLWSLYVKLLNKISRLVSSNLLYKTYNKIYPSPQMQIKWLTPKK